MKTVTEMMALRQSALDRLAYAPARERPPFTGMRIDVRDHDVTAGDTAFVPESLTRTLVSLLDRGNSETSPGAAVVTGLTRHFALEQARAFHAALFHAVWQAFRESVTAESEPDNFRVKARILSDGAIPLELYGSSWSFKNLHIDRDALLFSHLYGPAVGFKGGALLLVDIAPYMKRRSLRFNDAFQWSDEPSAGSKPVLRSYHCEAALAECGINLGALGPDEIVFVNNMPDAGILHGVTPVEVTHHRAFRREYHRCAAKDLRLR